MGGSGPQVRYVTSDLSLDALVNEVWGYEMELSEGTWIFQKIKDERVKKTRSIPKYERTAFFSNTDTLVESLL